MSGLYMLDYGAGNVRSLVNAVEKLGYNITFVKDPSDLKKAEVCIPINCRVDDSLFNTFTFFDPEIDIPWCWCVWSRYGRFAS
jgi:hypothetical protein